MRLHGMTTHPLFDITITMPKRHRTKKISHITYSFIFSQKRNFWGFQYHWVTKQEKVYISDLEKTILDGFERPDLCGGIKEIVRGIWIKQNEIDWEKLIRYAKIFRTVAAIKRLGYILELLEIGANSISELLKLTSSHNDYILLDPYGSKEGKIKERWCIRININIEELKAGVWA